MTRDRRTYLGGHDVGAILLGDQHPYQTPYGVWLAKTDPNPEPVSGKGEYWEGYPSEAAYWGADAEEGIARAYELKTGRKVQRPGYLCSPDGTIQHPDFPHLAGTPDGWADDGSGEPEGIVEMKTAGDWVWKAWDGDLPPQYKIQCLYYLGLTGEPWCDAVVKVGGNKLEIQRIWREAHQADIEAIIAYADAWWNAHVVANIAPPVSGGERTRDALLRRWGADTPIERIDVGEEWRAVIEERHRTHALVRDLLDQRDELDCQLAAAMNGATDAYLPGDEKPAWTWRCTTTTRDQPKAVRDAYEAALPPPDGITEDDVATAVRVLDAYRATAETRRLDTRAPRAKKGT